MSNTISSIGTSYPNIGSPAYAPNRSSSPQDAEPQGSDPVSSRPNDSAPDKKEPMRSAENIGSMDTVELSDKEERELQELKQRDQEVHKHEQAHKSAAGRYAVGGASFSYQTGPDGRRYAVGGEVSIDLSKGSTPEETVQKANTVRAAALAPAEPSAQDRKVAAEASRMAQSARLEIAQEAQAEQSDEGKINESPATEASGPPAAETESNGINAERAPAAPLGRTVPKISNGHAPNKPNASPEDHPDAIGLSPQFTERRAGPNLSPNPDRVDKAYRQLAPSVSDWTDAPAISTASLSIAV